MCLAIHHWPGGVSWLPAIFPLVGQVSKLSKYVGNWQGGLRHGEGTLWVRRSEKEEWGRLYRGGWKADRRHGYGTNWYPNGGRPLGASVPSELASCAIPSRHFLKTHHFPNKAKQCPHMHRQCK